MTLAIVSDIGYDAGMGRPSTGTPILVRIPEPTLTELDKRAQRWGVTRAEMIRRLLAAALFASLLLVVGVSGQADAADTCTVTSPADSGPGTLRALVADSSCQYVLIPQGVDTITLVSPLVIDRPVIVSSWNSGYVRGTTGRTVGAANLPAAPVPQPTTQIVNTGSGDGIRVVADGVGLHWLAVRGTTAPGSADVAVRGVNGFEAWGLVLGTDAAGGISDAPASNRTGSSTFLASYSTGVKVNQLVSGWTGNEAGGAVIFEVSTVSHLYRSFVVGSSYNSAGLTTLDAVAVTYGAADIIIRETLVAGTSSASAVELHEADRVLIDNSTLSGSGRDGVTVFDGHDVTVSGTVIDGAGRAGVGIYPNSGRVTVTGTPITAATPVAVF